MGRSKRLVMVFTSKINESEEKYMTNLDFLVIAAGMIAAAAVLTAGLMMVKNRRVRRVALYAAAVLGMYLGYVGLRINAPGFPVQCILAAALAVGGAAAVVLERREQYNASRIMAAVSVFGGMMNAFL